MPHINEMKGPSKYLTKEDVGRGALVTVKGVTQKNVAKEGDKPELKWLLWVDEFPKPMILNSTNIQLAARACLSENTDDWTGKKLVFYNDPNISFQGKLTGGIRIREPKPQAVAPVQAQKQAIAAAAAKWTQAHTMGSIPAVPEPAEEMLEEDQIPF